MITIRVYPTVQRAIDKNKLDLWMEIEFDKDPRTLKYFWLVAWRLGRKAAGQYFVDVVKSILEGRQIAQFYVKAIRDNLVNHPDLEEMLGLDSDYVIIDKSVYNQLRLEQEQT